MLNLRRIREVLTGDNAGFEGPRITTGHELRGAVGEDLDALFPERASSRVLDRGRRAPGPLPARVTCASSGGGRAARKHPNVRQARVITESACSIAVPRAVDMRCYRTPTRAKAGSHRCARRYNRAQDPPVTFHGSAKPPAAGETVQIIDGWASSLCRCWWSGEWLVVSERCEARDGLTGRGSPLVHQPLTTNH
jgi:hypothetical protein